MTLTGTTMTYLMRSRGMTYEQALREVVTLNNRNLLDADQQVLEYKEELYATAEKIARVRLTERQYITERDQALQELDRLECERAEAATPTADAPTCSEAHAPIRSSHE